MAGVMGVVEFFLVQEYTIDIVSSIASIVLGVNMLILFAWLH